MYFYLSMHLFIYFCMYSFMSWFIVWFYLPVYLIRLKTLQKRHQSQRKRGIHLFPGSFQPRSRSPLNNWSIGALKASSTRSDFLTPFSCLSTFQMKTTSLSVPIRLFRQINRGAHCAGSCFVHDVWCEQGAILGWPIHRDDSFCARVNFIGRRSVGTGEVGGASHFAASKTSIHNRTWA